MAYTRLHKDSLLKKEQAVSGVASRASVRDRIDEFQGVYGSRAESAAFRQQLGSDFSPSPQFQPPIQAKPSFRGLSHELAAESQAVQLKEEENKTGLPDDLKAGVEALSGFSMDDVRVHYNSSKPAQLQALAYTQGTEIHVGPGQEKHLAHEAWHVVQQMQGRVKPLYKYNNSKINDEQALEIEADKMATKTNTLNQQQTSKHQILASEALQEQPSKVIQRVLDTSKVFNQRLEGYDILNHFSWRETKIRLCDDIDFYNNKVCLQGYEAQYQYLIEVLINGVYLQVANELINSISSDRYISNPLAAKQYGQNMLKVLCDEINYVKKEAGIESLTLSMEALRDAGHKLVASRDLVPIVSSYLGG